MTLTASIPDAAGPIFRKPRFTAVMRKTGPSSHTEKSRDNSEPLRSNGRSSRPLGFYGNRLPLVISAGPMMKETVELKSVFNWSDGR
jgi:hypothetical protein